MGFPYKEFRRGQRESIDIIRKSLGAMVALNAPTGFGKTVVAVISHAGVGKVLYAVRTRNEMTPVINELRKTGTDFSFVFSASKMCPFIGRGIEPRPEDFWVNCRLVRERGLCPYFNNLSRLKLGDLREILQDPGNPSDPQSLAVLISERLAVCPYFSLTRLAEESEFTVVTYPYLFREEVFRNAFPNLGLDDFYVIVDEAHTLFNLQSVIDEELDEATVDGALKEVRKYSLGEELWNYLSNVKALLGRQRSELLKRVDKSEVYPGEGLLQLIEDALIEIRYRRIKEMLSDTRSVLYVSSAMSKVSKFLQYARREDFGVYGARVSNVSELHALPVSFDVVTERLSSAKGVLLMSGTMPDEEIVKAVMKKEVRYIDVERDFGSVFPPQTLFKAVYYPVTSSYRRRGPEMYAKYATLITSLFSTLEDGVMIAVYPSYGFMESVGELIVENNQVFETRKLSLEYVSRYARSADKLLLHIVSSGKFAEGIELIDEVGRSLIKLVLVVGVPYPQPDDYMKDLRRSLSKELSGELVRKVTSENLAAIRVRQAIGRSIRSEKDRAYVVLADKRYLTRRLREFLNLSYDLVTNSIHELTESLRRFLYGI